MSQQLPSQNSQFFLLMPTDFYPKEITDKYKLFFEKNKVVYEGLESYLNAQIMGFDFPGFNIKLLDQKIPYGKIQSYMSADHDQNLYSPHSIKVDMSDVDGHAAFFMIHDLMRYHYTDTKKQFLPEIHCFILDQYQDAIWQIKLRQCLVLGNSSLKFAFADQKVEAKTFSFDIHFNFLDINYILKETVNSTGQVLLDELITFVKNGDPTVQNLLHG